MTFMRVEPKLFEARGAMATTTTMNVLAVLRSPQLAEIISAAIKQVPGANLSARMGELKTLGPAVTQGVRPDVLIVDIDAEDPAELAALSHIMRAPEHSAMWTLATAKHATVATMRRLLREGVDDFLPQPLSEADVVDGLRTIIGRSKQHAHGKDGKVISFIQASGGVGGTALAVHTALSLAKPNGTVREVLLVDLDLQFGNAAMSLDLDYGPGLVDMIRSPERLDGTLLRGATVRHKSGLNVLPAPSMPVPLDALAGDTVGQILQTAKQEFDYVVVDLPRALTSWTEAALASSDMIALVLQLNVPAIRQARRLLDTLQEEGHYALPISIVCNRYVRRWGDNVDVKQAEKALGRKIDHYVANDYGVVLSALNQGVPVFDVKRRSGFSKDVHAFAKAAVQKIAAARTEDAKAAS
jgi:pilus assembly protein CpaE